MFVLLPIISLLFLAQTICTIPDQCLFNSSLVYHNPFPQQIFLSYNENRIFPLKNYFTGMNITFDIDSTSSNSDVSVNTKFFPYNNSFPFKNALAENNLTEVIDLFWDDSNVTDITQDWIKMSVTVLLTYNESGYYLIAGLIDNLGASGGNDQESYSLIPLPPFNKSQQMTCYNVTNVGSLDYYVDCTSYNSDGTDEAHYFIYIDFDDTPPSPSKVAYISNNLTLPQPTFPPPRKMKNVGIGNTHYMIRYNTKHADLYGFTTGIEVWNVTEPSNPRMALYYNASDPYLPDVSNISSVEVSSSYLYVISSNQQVKIISNWYTKPLEDRSYKFYPLTLQASSLRKVSTPTGDKESLIVIANIYNMNLTALLFVSQIYEGYYPIPLPPSPSYYGTKDILVFSVSLGEDFFVLSYSVAQASEEVPQYCYYLAILDISSQASNYCHSLFPYDSTNMITYARMNPAGGTDTLILFGNDNSYQYASIYSPVLEMSMVTETSKATLLLDNVEGPTEVSFEIVVVPPNSTDIFLINNSDHITQAVSGRGPEAYYCLSSSLYGPNMQFSVDFMNPVTSSNLYSNRNIQADLKLYSGDFFASRRSDMRSDHGLLIIEKDMASFVINYETIILSSRFSISEVKSSAIINIPATIKGYFSVGAYDVFWLTDTEELTGTEEYLLFGNSSQIFSLTNYSMRFNLTTVTQTLCDDLKLLVTSNTQLHIICMNSTSLSIIVLELGPPIKKQYSGVIDATDLNTGETFNPIKIQVHPAYPNTVFVLDANKNNTFVVNYTNPSATRKPVGSILSVAKIIFGRFPANAEDEIYIQPFLNSFFYIVPSLNLIQHWDISSTPYLRRNLDLYEYNIDPLNSATGLNGIAFSTTTDILYVLARNEANNDQNILVLKPNDANSYLLDVLTVPSSEIGHVVSLDVSTTQRGIYGYTLGDVLTVVVGNNYYLWEIYPSPFVIFQLASDNTNSNDSINSMATAICTVRTSSAQDLLNIDFQIFQDETNLYYTSNPSLQIEQTQFSLPIEINSFFGGTIYNIGLSNSEQSVTLSSLLTDNEPEDFPIPNVLTSWKLKRYSYYLTQNEIYISENVNKTIQSVSIPSSTSCSKLYIDPTETYGLILCDYSHHKIGLIPFQVSNLNQSLPQCTTPILPEFQEHVIDGQSQRLFILGEGEGQENDAIIIYSLDNTGCISSSPIYNIPGWGFAVAELDLIKFDVLLYSIDDPSQTANLFFIIDKNFGLRVISYLEIQADNYYQIGTFSFNDLYGSFANIPNDLNILRIQIVNNQCDKQRKCGTPCYVSVLIVSGTFHSLLLEFSIKDSVHSIKPPNITAFLVPTDYQIQNYEATKDLLVLLGVNATITNQTLDMIIYNCSTSALYYSNRIETSDATKYKSPIWVQTLIEDFNWYQDKTHTSGGITRHPLIFIEDNDSTDDSNYAQLLYFPHVPNQELRSYNIAERLLLTWDDSTYSQNNNISFKVSNNYQELDFSVIFEKKDPDPTNDGSQYIIFGAILVSILFILGIICFKRRRSQKVVFSKKKVKDPLRHLLAQSKREKSDL